MSMIGSRGVCRFFLLRSRAWREGEPRLLHRKALISTARYLVTFAALLTASAAMAGPPEHPWYVGLVLGKSQVEEFSNNDVRHDFVLGWQPLSYLAVEASYINLGRHEDASAPDPLLLINGFGGAMIGLIPVSERRSLLVRLGLHKLDIERNYEGYEPKLARIVGLGADWKPRDRLIARLELQHIADITDRHANGKYEALSLLAGLYYRF